MKVLLLIAIVFVVGVKGPAHPSDAHLTCDHDQIIMSLSKSHVDGLVDFTVEGVYLVNSSDPQPDAACIFTDTGVNYEFNFTGQNCPFETSEVNNVMTETFTAQLFTTPTPGAITTRDLIYCWTFSCSVNLFYNVSSGAITPYSRSFIFDEAALGTYTYSFSFFTDNTYDTEYLRMNTSYMIPEQAFVRLTVDAPGNIFLEIINCDVVNIASGDDYRIITGGCYEGGASGPVHSPASNQSLDFSFSPRLQSNDSNFDDEFFRLSCSTQLCDTLDPSTMCDPPCGSGRRRRNAALTSVTTVVNTVFAVRRDKCKELDCDHSCVHSADGSAHCLCREGFKLQADGQTCLDVSGDGAATED